MYIFQVSWYKNGKVIDFSGGDSKFSKGSDDASEIRIARVSKAEEGLYSCSARNQGRQLGLSSNQCCQIAKFDPFLSLDCARVKGGGRNPRKGRDRILQGSVAEPYSRSPKGQTQTILKIWL